MKKVFYSAFVKTCRKTRDGKMISLKNLLSIVLVFYIIFHIIDYFSPISKDFLGKCTRGQQNKNFTKLNKLEQHLATQKFRIQNLQSIIEEEQNRKIQHEEYNGKPC